MTFKDIHEVEDINYKTNVKDRAFLLTLLWPRRQAIDCERIGSVYGKENDLRYSHKAKEQTHGQQKSLCSLNFKLFMGTSSKPQSKIQKIDHK